MGVACATSGLGCRGEGGVDQEHAGAGGVELGPVVQQEGADQTR